MLSDFRDILCSKQCLHNRPGPTACGTENKLGGLIVCLAELLIVFVVLVTFTQTLK